MPCECRASPGLSHATRSDAAAIASLLAPVSFPNYIDRDYPMGMAHEQPWTGRAYITPGRLVFVGQAGTTAQHAHHAHQLVTTFTAPLLLRDAAGESCPVRAALIPANVAHTIAAPCAGVAIILLDPNDRAGRRLQALSKGAQRVADWVSAAAAVEHHAHVLPRTEQETAELLYDLIHRLVPDTLRPTAMHPAISRALRIIPALIERGEIRLDLLARELDISPSRLSHLFAQQVGTPLRPYVLWQRLMRVGDQLRSRSTLTEAALAAGFCDSAHLSHVFKRMFGMTPTVGWGAVEWSALRAPLPAATT